MKPEELASDPPSVMEPMFETLLALAIDEENEEDPQLGKLKNVFKDGKRFQRWKTFSLLFFLLGKEIRSLAAACLISFVVALGDTGKMLHASANILMTNTNKDNAHQHKKSSSSHSSPR